MRANTASTAAAMSHGLPLLAGGLATGGGCVVGWLGNDPLGGPDRYCGAGAEYDGVGVEYDGVEYDGGGVVYDGGGFVYPGGMLGGG